MLFQKWNPPPLVPQVEQKDHKPHGGLELGPKSPSEDDGSRGEGGGGSQDLKTELAKVPEREGTGEKRGGTGEDDCMGWGGHGWEGSSRATGMAGLYGRANLTLWWRMGCVMERGETWRYGSE